MSDFSERVKVNKNIEVKVFYMPASSHEVVCLDFTTRGTGQFGHINCHFQLGRRAATKLAQSILLLNAQYPAPTEEVDDNE